MNETDEVVTPCIEYLRAKGIYCWRNNSVGVWDPVKRVYRKNNSKLKINGVSDILGIWSDGRFFACECKRGRNQPSDDQTAFLEAIEKHGGIAMVVWSVDDLIYLVEQVLHA